MYGRSFLACLSTLPLAPTFRWRVLQDVPLLSALERGFSNGLQPDSADNPEMRPVRPRLRETPCTLVTIHDRKKHEFSI